MKFSKRIGAAVSIMFLAFMILSCSASPVYTKNGPAGTGETSEESLEEVKSGATFSGFASFYDQGFAGRPTANGEIYDPSGLTAAHKTLPFGTVLRVTLIATGKSVAVRINDRGPFAKERVLDLSRGAAERIGLVDAGVGYVNAQILKVGKE